MKQLRLAALLLPWCLAYKFQAPGSQGNASQDYGGHEVTAQMVSLIQEMTVALPLVLVNYTNASGLLHDRNATASDITFRAGNLSRDKAFVIDKSAGFYAVLNDFMGPTDTAKYCAPGVLENMWRCVHASVCIISSAVPQHVSMEVFSGLLEQVTRFEELTWPILRSGLMLDEGGDMLLDDFGMPEEYSCDGSVHEPALLQLSSSAGEALKAGTLAMSAALHSAMRASHEVLDSHIMNSSMDETIRKLQMNWRGVCNALGCDPTNYWDIYLRHHQHSLALLETDQVGLLHSDIRHRFLLQHRVQRFISTHHHDFSFVQKYARFGQEQPSSESVMRDYHARSKEALMKFVVPFVQSLPEERAVRLVDRQKLADKMAEGPSGVSPPHEDEASEIDDQHDVEGWEEGDDEIPDREIADHDMLDDVEAENEDEDGDQVETLPAGKKSPPALGNSTAMTLMEEEDSEGAKSGWGRRRRRRRRRRRSRRRRRWWKKLVEAVVKVVEVIVEALKCVGATSRFINTGYSRSIGTNVAWNIGLSAGATEPLADLLKGYIPSAWISVSTGFAVGSTTDWWWAGAGMSGSLGCSSSSGCKLGINVALLACGIAETPHDKACPLPDWIADPLGLKCGHSAGWSVSILCCTFNLHNGENNCR
ncbi:unnamed protein product [Symbiodinium sp. CCMP2592]|nr:unnamed protein product [Symbiodinium sp. CCMP2592]